MRILGLLAFLSVISINLSAHADNDVLANRSLTFPSQDPGAALDKVLSDLPDLFRAYKPALDSSTTLVVPFKVSGSSNHPILTMTIKKCVFIVCQTVAFDGEISYSDGPGKCLRNAQIEADLSHSSDTLRNVYDRFEVDLCLNNSPTGTGNLQISALAHRAAGYQSGAVQQAIFSFLQAQIQPISNVLAAQLETASGH